MDRARRWPRQPAVWHAQDRDNESATWLFTEERRPLQRASCVHRILGRAYAAEPRQIAGQHERGRRPGLPPASVPDGDPLQARARPRQMGSDAVRRAILSETIRMEFPMNGTSLRRIVVLL